MGMKKLNYFILVMILSVSIVSMSYGQDKGIKKGMGGGYFMVGGNMLDLDVLNNSLANAGYSEFSNNLISIGGGGHAFVNKLIIGGNGGALIGGEGHGTNASGNFKTSLTAGYGFFDLGYVLHSKGGLVIYPLLGLGGGGVTLGIAESAVPSFNDVLTDPKRSVKLTTGGFLVSFSIGMNYLVNFEEKENEVGGLIFGLQVGYIYAPIQGDWDMDLVDISGGPDVNVNGPFVRFLIGGGGRNK